MFDSDFGSGTGSDSSRWPFSQTLSAVLLLCISSLSRTFCDTPLLQILELNVCRTYYRANEPTVVGPDGWVPEEVCKIPQVQSRLSSLIGWNGFCVAVVGLLTAFPYAYLGERIDRRLIVLANLIGWIGSMVWIMAVCYFYNTFPVQAIWGASVFTLLGGSESVMLSMVNAILAESVPAASLSKTFFTVSALRLISHAATQSFAAHLMSSSLALPVAIGFALYPFSFPWLILLREPRYAKLRYDAICQDAAVDPLLGPSSSPPSSPFPSIDDGKQAALASPGILATLMLFFLNTLGHSISVTLPQHASLHFSWSLAKINYLLSLVRLFGGGTLLCLSLLTQYLSSRCPPARLNLSIAWASLGVTVLGVVGMGAAESRAALVMGMGLYMLGFGFPDAVKAWVSENREELTKFYVVITVAESVGGVVGGPLWSELWAGGVERGVEGKVFWCGAGVFMAMGLLMAGIVLGDRGGGEEDEERRRRGVGTHND
ncbi:hypothetical protein BDD12DRAFT_431897 [Trichophaea hybrida]|nr:hypothetical protein BDD12DRAFT_431897 [Trichophaea hybrida]